jgi:hypothetical protein
MPADLDVFLSHNSRDKLAVEAIGARLRPRGLSVWLDTWELRPGRRWQKDLAEAIERCRAVAVFVGESGLGPWEEPEMESFLHRAMLDEELPVIPVLLPGAPPRVELPRFLRLFTWVDLRAGVTEEGLDRLVWGITGARSGNKNPEAEGGAATAERPSQEGQLPGTRRRRWQSLRWGTALAVAGLVATLAAWLWPRTPSDGPGPPPSSSLPALYSLRIQVLEPQGRPVAASAVRVSAGSEPQRLPDGWWEVEIPAAKLPQDRSVTVWVESAAWEGSRVDLILGEDPNPRAEVRLRSPKTWLRGVVVDRHGRAVAGARILSRDGSGAAAETDVDGRFEIRLPAPRDSRVRLRAERAGFLPAETFCYAGRDHCSIELRLP